MLPTPDAAAHRKALLDRLEPDEALLVFAGPTHRRNGDADHRYRPDSDVWWLTGWPDPDAVVFLRPGEAPLTMFVQPRDPKAEVWHGRRPGPEGAKARFGADAAHDIGDLDRELPQLLQGVRTLHYGFGRDAEMDRRLQAAIAKAARAGRRNGLDVPEVFVSPSKVLHELRLHKTADELAVMREAARISAAAHVQAMGHGAPGTHEYELEALLDRAFRAEGGTGAGYNSIVAAGDNACILHYVTNDDVIEDGELVLIDAGGEVAYYTADITRTWPANGRFSPAQRDVYAAVLAAQHAAIDAVKPGATFMDVHDVAVRRLTEAMVDLELLSGDVDDLIHDEAFKRYYMHGTSHWLGLDVHDVGAYARDGHSRSLAPGMVLTIEPGLYIPPDDEDAPEALRGIGVRIEDDVLVTDGAAEVLTDACPKAIDDIEAACAR